MLKVYAFILSGLFLIQSVNIHFEDVLAFNELLEHAEMHQNRYGDDFLVFISKHYGSLKDAHKLQHEQEEKGRQHQPIEHDCNTQIQTALEWQYIAYSVIKVIHQIEVNPNFYYQDQFSTFEKESIFQPPKFT